MKTVKILTSQAQPSMVVANDIFTRDDHLIIAKNTILTSKIIARLEFYSIYDFSVVSDVEVIPTKSKDLFPEAYYSDKVKNSESFKHFNVVFKNTVGVFKNTLDSIVTGQSPIDTDSLLSQINGVLSECSTNIELFDMIHCMRQYDDTTYVHSLNVSLISNTLGKWLNFSKEDLEVVTLCGLLHDIGKLMIPEKIIAKPGKLTATELSTVRTHTLHGYNLLKNKHIDTRIKYTALLHHERCDGSGYPYNFNSEQIEPFAKLVAIADVYEAMTCSRVYRDPLCPFEVVNLFESEGLSKYDPLYIMTFLEGIIQTYLHNHVRLSNNQVGEIVLINKLSLSKPVVKVGEQFIDLSKQHDLHIVAII